MNIRKYERSDYPIVCEWWSMHKWPNIPASMLPSTGFIIDKVCAGFLYKTDSTIGILEFIISNPNSDVQIRSNGLNLLIETLVAEAKVNGMSAIFTSVNNNKLINRYKDLGFTESDKNITNMVRVI